KTIHLEKSSSKKRWRYYWPVTNQLLSISNMIKYLLYFLLSIAIMGGLSLLFLFFAPEKNLSRQSADLSISATELFNQYEADEVAGNQKFIDRIIDVSGTIAEISKDEEGAPVVILRETDAFSGILCTLKDSERQALAQLSVGNQVTIRGFCTGMLMDVVLNKCVIIDK
ncbi:MAG: hypothetical protein AAGK47_09800, partial [Bacteroidota bacterium]